MVFMWWSAKGAATVAIAASALATGADAFNVGGSVPATRGVPRSATPIGARGVAVAPKLRTAKPSLRAGAKFSMMTAAAPSSAATQASPAMKKLARDNFNTWNNYLIQKDYKRVAELYCDQDLSFLPTVSPNFIRDPAQTQKYFMAFIENQPDGTITDDSVQTFGNDDAYLHTGMYTFVTGPDSARTPIKARFSYMWRKMDGKSWKIVHHHSSVVPETVNKIMADEAMYPIAQECFNTWNEALKEKNYDKVASLYSSEDLSFLPTVSPKFIRDAKQTKQYFMEFIKKQPAGTITSDDVQAYGKDAFLHTGMYTFMTGPDDARAPVEARFSYMWRRINNAWKIVHHHSSAVPKAPGSAVEEQAAENMYPIAQENFNTWNSALVAKDFDKVASLYSSKELSFLPTVSPKFIRDEFSTKEYFVEFVKKLPCGTITADDVQPYGKDAYLHTGMYTFQVGEEGARSDVEARFSYMWRRINNAWQIVHHHSSAVPKPGGSAPEQVDAEKMYPIAQANFKTWNDALIAKDFNKVASLYSSKELSFLPTVSPKFIRDTKSTKDYFVEFVKKFPSGTITADDVQPYGPDAYLHSGQYTFQVGPADARSDVEARFSYMWRKVDGNWQIVHHHSSAVPKTPEEVKEGAMYAMAQDNFKTWNDALVAKDFEKVASLYCDKELSFLPTVSPKFIQDPVSTKEYFIEFVKKLPQGTITADNVQPYGPDAYLHSGMYTFMTGPEDARAPVNARFSYMWKKTGNDWKIVHHHSSAVPAGATKPEEFTLTSAEDKEPNIDAALEKETEAEAKEVKEAGGFSAFISKMFK